MARFVFFLLLVANVALAAHLWLTRTSAEPANPQIRDVEPGSLKLISVADPQKAKQRIQEQKSQTLTAVQAGCVELSGIAAANAQRARDMLAALDLGPRLLERKVEEVSRYWVFIPAQKDKDATKKAVDFLKGKGVKDILVQDDNMISLGVFSTQESAQRHLSELRAKGAQLPQMGPRNKELKEVVFTVVKPDAPLVQRLDLVSKELAGSALKPATCPAG